MTGTEVRLDAGGTWWCRPYLGTDSRGRQVRPYRSFPSARSREEAQALADSWLSTLSADGSPTGGRLRDLLADYVDARETCGASPNSVRTWRLFAGYVDARMGTALARDVTAADMARLERDLARPRAEGGQGLARNSVRGVHMFLRAAFSHLCRSGVVDTNPMLSVDPPSRESHEAAVVDEWDFAALDSALSAELGPGGADGASLRRAACALAAWLSLRTGVRCGEACALRRRDVRPAQGCVHVAGTVIEQRGRAPWRRDVTKGRKCRNVAVTADVTAAVSALEAAQDAALGRLGPRRPRGDGRRLVHAPHGRLALLLVAQAAPGDARGRDVPLAQAHPRRVVPRGGRGPQDALGAPRARRRGHHAQDLRAPPAGQGRARRAGVREGRRRGPGHVSAGCQRRPGRRPATAGARAARRGSRAPARRGRRR